MGLLYFKNRNETHKAERSEQGRTASEEVEEGCREQITECLISQLYCAEFAFCSENNGRPSKSFKQRVM